MSLNDSSRSPTRRSTKKSKPQYQRIADVLENRIQDRVYEAHEALPTFNALAEEFQVSLVTVNKAIQELDGRGRIIRRRGKGVYASPNGQSLDGNNGNKPVTRTIGLIIPDLANPFFAATAKHIQTLLHTENYSVITQSTDGSLARWNGYLQRFLDHHVDGVILVPLDTSRVEKEDILWHLKIAKIPFVYLNSEFNRVPSDYVIIDVAQGVRDIANFLIDAGHERFACVSAEPYMNLTRQKSRTFCEEIRAHGFEISEENIIVSSLEHHEGGKEAGLELLSRPADQRPTAIFATNDIIAFGVMAAATELGLSVPDDISVIGFDNIEASRFTTPPLTTVSQPTEEMAAKAAKIILRRIAKDLPSEFEQHVFSPQLVERGSTKVLEKANR